VETIHRLVEDEFFDRECIANRAQFWAKVRIYWYCFNLAHPNHGEQWHTPLQIRWRARCSPASRLGPRLT
jgi:hypothetical protein